MPNSHSTTPPAIASSFMPLTFAPFARIYSPARIGFAPRTPSSPRLKKAIPDLPLDHPVPHPGQTPTPPRPLQSHHPPCLKPLRPLRPLRESIPRPAMGSRQERQGLKRRSPIRPLIIHSLIQGKPPLHHAPYNPIILHALNLCVLCVLCANLFPSPEIGSRQARQGS